ncbi:MAG: hypothetical protein Q7U42_01700, partial [Parvibaculum sp.]|nr:hypothetical protein [Parvibaculum sp.]
MNGFHRYIGQPSGAGTPRHFLFGMAVLLLMLFALPLAARAAEPLSVSLSEADGYGRMTFSHPGGMPKVNAAINTGVLVLDFDRPAGVEADRFMQAMPRYVSMARQDGDRRTFRLALTTDFRLDIKKAENTVYVDLLPPDWTGNPPPLPANVLERVAA